MPSIRELAQTAYDERLAYAAAERERRVAVLEQDASVRLGRAWAALVGTVDGDLNVPAPAWAINVDLNETDPEGFTAAGVVEHLSFLWHKGHFDLLPEHWCVTSMTELGSVLAQRKGAPE